MNRFAIRRHHEPVDIPDLDAIIGQLLNHEPIQYIFGHTEWMGLNLQVNTATLIPRPETAELVERIAAGRYPSTHTPIRVLDIGTGSGCIALALKQRHPEWQVTGIDISAEAIEVAQGNAERNGLDVSFRQADILYDRQATIIQNAGFTLVVSNPPYIRPSEQTTMTPNTLLHEPHQALFVPEDDPLLFYRRIAGLRAAPELWFEINENLGSEMLTLMHRLGYEAECLTDMYGKQRFIHATTRPANR